jgi:alpha-tubulin suppressor-like RCC1 family protein
VDHPTAVASPGTFLQMGEKNVHTCGIATDGFAYCWGANASGELGNGTT